MYIYKKNRKVLPYRIKQAKGKMSVREFTEIPYYEFAGTISDNISKSSSKRGVGKTRFIVKKILNVIFSLLAYNCPINSWRVRFHKWRGVNIDQNVFIGLRVTLDHAFPEYIYLKSNTILSGNNYILTHSNPYKHFNKTLLSYVAPVIIEQGAWIGVGAMLLPGVKIGEYAVISAGSVVTNDVEPQRIVAGNPAKEIGKVKL
jgi:acetyltransferase-like isoleucine patch superfamily enzyme